MTVPTPRTTPTLRVALVFAVAGVAFVALPLIWTAGPANQPKTVAGDPFTDRPDVAGTADREPTRQAADDSIPSRREAAPVVGAIEGVVRWQDGTPVTRAQLACRSRFPLAPRRYVARSGADGSFRFDSIPFGGWDLECEHDDAVDFVERTIRHDATSKRVDVRLSKGLSISGTIEVLGSDGSPRFARAGSLYAFGPGDRLGHGRIERDGTFRIGGLQPELYELVLWERTARLDGPTRIVAGTHGVRLRAQRGRASVHGVVTDTRGRAVPRFDVEVLERAAGRRMRRQSVHGKRGEYEVTGLPRGTYDVVIRAEGARTVRSAPIVLDDSESHEIDARLDALPPIGGLVRDAAGRPLEGADVYVLGAFEEPVVDVGSWVLSTRLTPHQRPLGFARTNEEGAFRMPGISEIEDVAISHPDHVTLEWNLGGRGALPARLDVRLEPGARVRGRLVGTLRKATRELLLIPSDEPGRSAHHRARHATSAFDGSFTFPGIGPGEWELHLVGWKNALLLRRFDVGSGDDAVALGAIELDLDR